MVWPQPLGQILQLTDFQKPKRLIFGSTTRLMDHHQESPATALPHPGATFGPHPIRPRWQGVEKPISLLRQSASGLLAGYDDSNDTERLAQDPAMRVVMGWQGSERKAVAGEPSVRETRIRRLRVLRLPRHSPPPVAVR